MTADEELKDDFVREAEFDWIEFSDAMAVVKIVEGGDPEGLLRRAGPLVVQLVREGRLIPGELPAKRGTGFRPWPLAADAAADRVAVELEPIYAREQEIIPGEICWFTTPDDPGVAVGSDSS